jgi:arylsulfatase A-like enzyme
MWNDSSRAEDDMPRPLTIIRVGALIGALLGLCVGLIQWPWVWPKLTLAALARTTAQGWLGGLAVSLLLLTILPRRPAAPTGPRPPRRLPAPAILLTLAALAPAALWVLPLAQRLLPSPPGEASRLRADARPNIVLITIDALRADHLGAYGSTAGLTPNLDAFARQAARYHAAYASAPWTLPSFAALFTSLPPSECGLTTSQPESTQWYSQVARLPDRVPLLSEQLQRAGYVTAAVLTNPFLFQERGWNRGFHHFRNEDGPDVTDLLTSDTTRAHTVTHHARLWLRMNHRQPFFLWVHYLDPHAPYDPPGAPPDLRTPYPDEWGTDRPYWHDHMRDAPPAVQARYADFCRTMYAQEVRYADRFVGELLREIARYDGDRQFLTIITSDHGEELFDHGGFEHGHSVYQELLHVPLLVQWPHGTEADRDIYQTVGLMDLAPTLLEIAGADPMPDMRGRGLPTRDGGPGVEVYSEALLHGAEQTALTTDDYKIIYHPHRPSGAPKFQVYARRSDPAERRDLAAQQVALDLRDRLRSRADAAHICALQWEASRAGDDRPRLADSTRRKLRTLGYLAD